MTYQFKLAPVVLFVYNRPWHTRQTIEALKKNELANQSELFIFSDGTRNNNSESEVNEVRNYIKTIYNFKKITIIEREKNYGLAANIIAGVSKIVHEHGKAIIIEDDLVTSPFFLRFMNEGLEKFQEKTNIGSISGYSFLQNCTAYTSSDLYLSHRHSSWGWGTWRHVWEKIDWEVNDYSEFRKSKKLQRQFNRGGNDLSHMLILQMEGKINSWSIRFDYHCAKNDLLCVLPFGNMVTNIGFDGSGTHCGLQGERCDIIDSKFWKNANWAVVNDTRIHEKIKRLHDVSFISRLKANIIKIIAKRNSNG